MSPAQMASCTYKGSAAAQRRCMLRNRLLLTEGSTLPEQINGL